MKRVPMTAEQAALLDELVIPMLMRAKLDNEATAMMSLALTYRFLPESDPLPDNVVELEQWSKKVGA